VRSLPSHRSPWRPFPAPLLPGCYPAPRARQRPQERRCGSWTAPEVHLLTVRAAAGRLGVSTATVYALCTSGQLAHARVGNSIRIAPADLDAFLAAGTR
jgi:excisionase family DNA binding protein